MTIAAASTATAPTDPRLAERLESLAAASRTRQLAPPFLGDETGIKRRRFASPTPVNTWTATRVDLAGGIVAQLGSRPSDTFNLPSTETGYQIEQLVQPGYHVWTASLRVISVSRLPASRTAVSGFLSVAGATPDYQALVPGRTQLFTTVFWVPDARWVRLRCGIDLSMFFGPGQNAYTEGIVQVQSIVHHEPPSASDPAAALVAEPAANELDEVEVEIIESDDDEVERVGGFED